jgi:glyoxylase-like metal-dependent hydrolase (beta-lactamase superfamily II)
MNVGACLLMTIGGFASIARSQDSGDSLDIVRLRSNFYVIAGAGGNISAQIGPDGVVLVDAGSSEAASRVLVALKKVTDQPIRYIINTGPDADHVGGNGALAKAGRSIFAAGMEPLGGDFAKAMTNGFAASIIAPNDLLLRMSAPTGQIALFPADSWPTEAFAEKRKYIYMNREGIEIFRLPAAHSDSDSFVFFRASDVIAAGDVLDANHFPLIDLEKGGSIQGEIDALNRLIDLSVRPIPFIFQGGGTYIIPGHGHVYDLSDVVEYRDMIVIIRNLIQDMIDHGKTLAQIQEASPAKGWEQQYGSHSGPGTTNNFVEAIYKSLTRRSK